VFLFLQRIRFLFQKGPLTNFISATNISVSCVFENSVPQLLSNKRNVSQMGNCGYQSSVGFADSSFAKEPIAAAGREFTPSVSLARATSLGEGGY
jgi:hypothetical protein